MSSKLFASSALMIIWLVAKCNALSDNTTTVIKKENQVISMPEAAEHVVIHQFSKGQKAFYNHPLYSAYTHNNKKIPFYIQPREVINKDEIYIDMDKRSSIEKLSNLLTQLQYKPVVVLVDDTFTAFKNAEEYTNILLDQPWMQSEFWLMEYNFSGVTSVTAQSRVNPESFKKQLAQKKDNINHLDITRGSAVFFAILKATQILPKNTAILIFSERNPIDENLSQLTTTNLRQKNIKLNVIWIGHISNRHKENILEDTAKYTNGLFIIGNRYKITSIDKDLPNTFMGTKKAIIIRKNVHDRKVAVPVDRTLTDLEILIEGRFTSASLTSPIGFTVDLLNAVSVKQLTLEASSAHDQGRWAHIRFDTRKINRTPVVGMWELHVGGAALGQKGYNLSIYAETEIFFDTHVFLPAQEPYAAKQIKEKKIELDVHGDVSIIDDVSIIYIGGKEISQIPYSLLKNKDLMLHENNTNNQHQLMLLKNTSIPANPFYIKINGKNKNGEAFSRVTYVDQNAKQLQRRPMLLIETGIHSELIASPGSNPKILFKVTNNYDYSVAVPFSVQDEKSMLRDLFPTR